MYNDFHEDYLMHYEKGQRAKDAKYSKIHISKNGKPWYEYPRSYYNTVKSFANNFGKNMGKTITNFKNSKEAKNVANKFKKATESVSKAVKDIDIKKTGKDVLDKTKKVAKSTGDSLKKTGKDALEKAKKVATNTKKKVEDVTGITAKKNLVGNQTKLKLSQREFNTHNANAMQNRLKAAEKKSEIKKLTNVGEIDDGRESIKKLLERAKQSDAAAKYEAGRISNFAKDVAKSKSEYDKTALGKIENITKNLKSSGKSALSKLISGSKKAASTSAEVAKKAGEVLLYGIAKVLSGTYDAGINVSDSLTKYTGVNNELNDGGRYSINDGPWKAESYKVNGKQTDINTTKKMNEILVSKGLDAKSATTDDIKKAYEKATGKLILDKNTTVTFGDVKSSKSSDSLVDKGKDVFNKINQKKQKSSLEQLGNSVEDIFDNLSSATEDAAKNIQKKAQGVEKKVDKAIAKAELKKSLKENFGLSNSAVNDIVNSGIVDGFLGGLTSIWYDLGDGENKLFK